MASASAQRDRPSTVDVPGPLGKIERTGRVEVGQAGDDDPHHGDEHPGPEHHHQSSRRGDPPVGHHGDESQDADRGHLAPGHRADRPVDQGSPVPGRAVERGEEITEVLRHAEGPGGDLERSAEEELPDEEELEQATGAALAVDGVVEVVGAARAREGRRQLAPDHPVANGNDAAEHPAEHRLRAQHRAEQCGDGDERPDPHHHRHVQADRLEQTQPPLQHRHRPPPRRRGPSSPRASTLWAGDVAVKDSPRERASRADGHFSTCGSSPARRSARRNRSCWRSPSGAGPRARYWGRNPGRNPGRASPG